MAMVHDGLYILKVLLPVIILYQLEILLNPSPSLCGIGSFEIQLYHGGDSTWLKALVHTEPQK